MIKMKLDQIDSREYSIKLDHIELWKLQEILKDNIITIDQRIELFKDSDICNIYENKKKLIECMITELSSLD